MPPISTTTRRTSLGKRRPHGKPPSAGTTSTQSSGSPKFERSEQRQRIERPHLTLPARSPHSPRSKKVSVPASWPVSAEDLASASCAFGVDSVPARPDVTEFK